MAVSYEDKPNIVQVDKSGNNIEIAFGGPQGPVGPQGPPGENPSVSEIIAAVSYTHNQLATSSFWTIQHNLGFYPNVTVFDSADTGIEGEIIHNDENSLTITFSASISGKAHLS